MIHTHPRSVRDVPDPPEPHRAARRTSVLTFLTALAEGGTERQVMNLVQHLDQRRFAVRFACFHRSDGYVAAVEALGAPISQYTIRRLYGVRVVREQWRLSREIRTEGVDIVHAYNFYGNVFAVPAARLAGAPVVVASIRGMDDLLTPWQRRAQRLVCRAADCVLTNAEAIQQRLVARGYDPRRITVIPNGIDVARFERRREAGLQFRHELGLPPEAPLVVLVTRLVPGKGIPDFLEAVRIVAAQVPDARFVVVGGGGLVRDGRGGVRHYSRDMEALAARLGLQGRVVFTGMRSDVPSVLSAATVSVLPSLSEGLPNAILESMAAGLPVVATRVGGTPEAVQDGVTGLLVPPRDPAALVAALRAVIEDRELAARLGQAAKRRVTEWFSLERMVRRTEQLYDWLLARARRPRSPAAWSELPMEEHADDVRDRRLR
jgi:glycosyltransferase involved in cell wall biosynthesis